MGLCGSGVLVLRCFGIYSGAGRGMGLVVLTWYLVPPSLFPHSLHLSSIFLTSYSQHLRPMVGLGDCPVCPCEVVVEWRDEENECEHINHLTE
jgi:hypothetical protein